ncbi:hypothetical protein ACHAQA_003814 [Verticillium albo-atrum]
MPNLQGQLFQSALSVLLAVTCVICYVLLVLLYIRPETFHIESLVNPDRTTIKPTVAVSLIAVVLKSATVALVTRCVEHSLWIGLGKGPDQGHALATLTVGETRRLAQWCTSTLDRFLYLFGGFTGKDKRSWLLRFGGPLLIATATVGPVLLIGISESQVQTLTTETVVRAADPWLSHLDAGNVRYRGGNSYDTPTAVAALAAMRNLSAPVAPLCQNVDSRSTCSVSARAVSIRATCTGSSAANPNRIGTISGSSNDTERFCTGENTVGELCVELMTSSPATYSAFSSGPPACSSESLSDCPGGGIGGQWGRVYGVWVNGVDITADSENRINNVNCELTYGNITVRQNGTSPPVLDRASYTQATSTEAFQYGLTNASIVQLNRIYSELGNSPYDWSLAAVGTGANTIYRTSVAFLLLGQDANNDAETVARQIEANFEMATLHAFARGSNSSDLVFTRSHRSPAYVYEPIVLLILLVPLLATILGTWARWRVAGDNVTVGYDPIGIARLGPVDGLTHGPAGSGQYKKQEDSSKVWRWTREVNYSDGSSSTATGIRIVNHGPDVTQEQIAFPQGQHK